MIFPSGSESPTAKAAYVAASARMPMLACRSGDDLAGIVSLKFHTTFAVEIHVIGVMRRLHRQGIGRRLVEEAALTAQARGPRYLTVKTLAASRPDPHYAATRRFYEALGFLPIEVFPRLWGPTNPRLYMIRALPAGS